MSIIRSNSVLMTSSQIKLLVLLNLLQGTSKLIGLTWFAFQINRINQSSNVATGKFSFKPEIIFISFSPTTLVFLCQEQPLSPKLISNFLSHFLSYRHTHTLSLSHSLTLFLLLSATHTHTLSLFYKQCMRTIIAILGWCCW